MYNSCMKILLIAGFISLFSIQPVSAGQTLKEIMTPPADSVDRENLRIWVPVERGSRCRMTVDILDDSNQVVRHLVNYLAGRGYHNYYWDKKDDSGAFADSGSYTYLVDNCGKKKRGQIQVSFSGVIIEVASALGFFAAEFQGDSMSLIIEQRSIKDSLVSTLTYKNLRKGFHKFNLPKISRLFLDRYIQLIYVNGKLVDRKQSKGRGLK